MATNCVFSFTQSYDVKISHERRYTIVAWMLHILAYSKWIVSNGSRSSPDIANEFVSLFSLFAADFKFHLVYCQVLNFKTILI